uniref:Putative secreted protein n=1 Tax=Lutzomyia longipalpis TaxID=7200 RepID=A0A7G3AML1_LUTLO
MRWNRLTRRFFFNFLILFFFNVNSSPFFYFVLEAILDGTKESIHLYSFHIRRSLKKRKPLKNVLEESNKPND